MLFSRDTWSEIYHALSKNKLRTGLTMIGVAWGMLLFVFLLGLVNGMRNGFDRDLKGTSTNSMFLWASKTSIPFHGYGRGRVFDLNLDDITAIERRFPEVSRTAARNVTQAPIVHGSMYSNFSVYGDYPDQNKMFVKKILEGRFLTEDDIINRRKVCVLGEGAVTDLFKDTSKALGQQVKILNSSFTIVGIYSGDQNSFEGDKGVHIPYSTFARMFNEGDKVGWVSINFEDTADITAMEKRIKDFLKTRHDVHPDDTQAFGSFNLGELFGKIFSFMRGLEFLTIIVGFLTLTAGVIAVSSILLITVKERTKEFGIRRALGATPSQILSQILLESGVITFLSGIIGIFLGTVILYIANTIVDNMEDSNIPLINSSVDILVLLLSFLIVLVMAILAGLLPAMRAIAIKPIDALRQE